MSKLTDRELEEALESEPLVVEKFKKKKGPKSPEKYPDHKREKKERHGKKMESF